MPTPIDKLEKMSGQPQVQAAISECVAMEMNRGTPQEQAVAMCMEMARKRTGKELAPKGQ